MSYVVICVVPLIYVCPSVLSIKYALAFFNNGYLSFPPKTEMVDDPGFAFPWNLDDALIPKLDYIFKHLELNCGKHNLVMAVEYGVNLDAAVACKESIRILNPTILDHSQNNVSCEPKIGRLQRPIKHQAYDHLTIGYIDTKKFRYRKEFEGRLACLVHYFITR